VNAQPEFSVVIATKDRAGFLERVLDSLAAQREGPVFETIVVDNGSRDWTPELLQRRARNTPYRLRSLTVAQPNRGAARNAGIRAAAGRFVAFVDDDVWLPERFIAAHAAAQRGIFPRAVSGPIINVPAYDSQPKPWLRNYSGAFFCTCNVSVPRTSLVAVGGFDESFDLYGWEDTELGLRLRRHDVRHTFAWDAYLWHIKPPELDTFEVLHEKTVERARMAARLLQKDRSLRTKLATGAYGFNLVRSALFAPAWSLDAYRRLSRDERLPPALRNVARKQFLDGAYRTALRRALTEAAP
jgi:glycosyltransferase involved in cell wall biosynthesis